VPKSSGRAVSLGWLVGLVGVPLSVWFAAGNGQRFEGKSLSNLSLEPLLITLAGCVVFVIWALAARARLKPLSGVILLIILSAAAFAVQHFVPSLRE
jgi:hypothetical protein